MTSKAVASKVGRRLGVARLQRGLSQGTVARRAGIAPSYLSRIENCKIEPTFRTVMRIQRAMHADINEIVGAGKSRDREGGCPVTKGGICLLDLIRPESEVLRSAPLTEYYSPREIRLLKRMANWLKTAPSDRVRAMEILLDDLTRASALPCNGGSNRR